MASFSELFETVKGKAVEGAQVAMKKTQQAATVAKANLAIRAEEDKIKKAQQELGKLYYKDYIVGATPDPEEYNPWCEKISEAKIAIEDLKITIEEAKAGTDAEEEPVVEITEDDLVEVESEIVAEVPAEEAAAEEAPTEEPSAE